MASLSRNESRSLYHRWRSKSFSELVAQEHVTRTLRNAVASGRIVHAYLFCGPRGTGKTSTARILAKAVNCLEPQQGEPCNRCSSCVAVNSGRAIDLIEIDAASNRGIDDARELREKIKFSPAESRYKVYIIDEAHMLTSEASNALLKTLEEPPEHAILILATTESHKILPTIASRCQRFDFHRIPLQAITGQLEMICEREGLEVEPGVLERVARMARGSLRDAESLLDQLVAYCGQRIDLPSVREVLGLTGEEMVPEFVEALRRRDVARGFRLIDEAATAGADLRHFGREVVDYLRALMVVRSGADSSLIREFRGDELDRLRSSARGWEYQGLVAALRAFSDLEGRMRAEPMNQVHLEIAFTEVALLAGVERPEPAGASPGVGVLPASASPPGAGAGSGPSASPTRAAASEAAPAEPSAGGEVPEATVAAETEAVGPAAVDASDAAGARAEGAELVPREQPPVLDLANLRGEWPRIVEEFVASGSTAIAMVLDGCEPIGVAGNKLTFGFRNAAWRDRVERLGARRKVEETVGRLFGKSVLVEFKYGVSLPRDEGPPGRDAVVEAAMREFGFQVLREEEIPD